MENNTDSTDAPIAAVYDFKKTQCPNLTKLMSEDCEEISLGAIDDFWLCGLE